MKVLVYGSRGWIGSQFIEILKNNNINFVTGIARIDDDSLYTEINSINPTHIISFIGRTHGMIDNKKYTTIDYLEQPGKLTENIRDNLYSPLLLANICKQKNIHYTYIGTGCIFKFDEEHPFEQEQNGFDERDKPNFFGSSYSIVKGFTDRLMHLYENSVLNLRIRMPITGEENSRNFITKIINYKKICSIKNSMTVLPELLPFVLDMMKNRTVGTMNLTNPGLISHNEILDMYKEIVDPTFEYENFSAEAQRKILACDRSNNYLDTSRLEKLYPNVRNIKDAVRDCLYSYKEYLIKHPRRINLLVTGGCGFIGSNFINYIFDKQKYNIVNLDAMYYCANENNVKEEIRKSEHYHLIKGNINDKDLVHNLLRDYKITQVIHFAAQSHVDNSFSVPLQYTYDNVQGTHTLLEEVRQYGCELSTEITPNEKNNLNKNIFSGKVTRFIHVSTDEVYGESMLEADERHKTEQSVLCPTNPYAASKAGAELIAQSYNHSFKMPIIISRGNNVYGENQYPEKVIPKFIKLLKEDKKVTIQGDGSVVRAFLHAYDTARAFETILEKGVIGEIYNIGCDEGMEYSIKDVAQMLIKKIKNTENYDEWIEYVADRPFNDKRYYISNQKLKDLGWNIKVKFEEGLEKLV
jgi:3,5-epimerase/4-reductase